MAGTSDHISVTWPSYQRLDPNWVAESFHVCPWQKLPRAFTIDPNIPKHHIHVKKKKDNWKKYILVIHHVVQLKCLHLILFRFRFSWKSLKSLSGLKTPPGSFTGMPKETSFEVQCWRKRDGKRWSETTNHQVTLDAQSDSIWLSITRWSHSRKNLPMTRPFSPRPSRKASGI